MAAAACASTSSTSPSADLGVRVVIGRVGKPHGIGGQVYVEPRTDEPEQRFAPGSALWAGESARTLIVERAQWHSGRLLISFRDIGDRTAAESLRGTWLQIERADDDRPDDPDEFYDSALEGCSVVLRDGTLVGTVGEVVHLPAQDLLAVRRPGQPEVLVPFVEQFVPEISLAERRIVIDPPGGLLDLGPDPGTDHGPDAGTDRDSAGRAADDRASSG